jgi:hypothetical protein
MDFAEAKLRAALRGWFESGGSSDRLMQIINEVWENTSFPSEETESGTEEK